MLSESVINFISQCARVKRDGCVRTDFGPASQCLCVVLRVPNVMFFGGFSQDADHADHADLHTFEGAGAEGETLKK